MLRLAQRQRSSSASTSELDAATAEAAGTAPSRLKQINEARIGLQFLHPNIVHVYAYAARIINLDTIMAKVQASPFCDLHAAAHRAVSHLSQVVVAVAGTAGSHLVVSDTA